MEKENLCTLKSFMASGAEAFAQAQVVRATLFTEPPWLKGPVCPRTSASHPSNTKTHINAPFTAWPSAQALDK